MLREQREEIFNTLMVFEESTEEKTFKKYNKFKEQIEEIKRDFPEDKKKRNLTLVWKTYLELEMLSKEVIKEINHYIKIMESKNLSNSESRKIIKTLKDYKEKSLFLITDSEYSVKENISTLLNSSLDSLLKYYKNDIDKMKKKIETDTKRLDGIIKNNPNMTTKLTVNFIKSNIKKLYGMTIERDEKELTSLIYTINKVKKEG